MKRQRMGRWSELGRTAHVSQVVVSVYGLLEAVPCEGGLQNALGRTGGGDEEEEDQIGLEALR